MTELPQKLDEFYRGHRQSLYTYALSLTRRPDLAEDALQEAFLRLHQLRHAPDNLPGYIWRTVRNAAIDQLRRASPAPEELDEYIFDGSPGPDRQAEARIFARRVAAALLGLSDDERETIVQHIYGGLSFREIAEIRLVPLGTVTSWYQRGIRKLRVPLEGG